MWNRAFNKGISIRSFVRTMTMLLWEFCLLGDLDSVILDAPLSSVGCTQAAELRAWLEGELGACSKSTGSRLIEAVNQGKIAFVSSNLR